MGRFFWTASMVGVFVTAPLASASADWFGNPGGAPAPEIGATAVGALLAAGIVRYIRSRRHS